MQGDFSTFASAELRGVVAPDPTVAPAPVPTPTPSPTTKTAAAPVAKRAPWITRKAHALTCHAGTWSNKPTSLSYRWYVNGHSKKVASGHKLKVHRSLRGRMVACRVTAQNAAGRKTASSRSVRAR